MASSESSPRRRRDPKLGNCSNGARIEAYAPRMRERYPERYPDWIFGGDLPPNILKRLVGAQGLEPWTR